jgi:hypothetical protein
MHLLGSSWMLPSHITCANNLSRRGGKIWGTGQSDPLAQTTLVVAGVMLR